MAAQTSSEHDAVFQAAVAARPAQFGPEAKSVASTAQAADVYNKTTNKAPGLGYITMS